MPMEPGATPKRMRAPGPSPSDITSERVVVVEAHEGAWRVRAAHMEPLRFRSGAEAERAGRRVAQTLSRLGFDACLETFDAEGELAASQRYPAETEAFDLRPTARRQLHS